MSTSDHDNQFSFRRQRRFMSAYIAITLFAFGFMDSSEGLFAAEEYGYLNDSVITNNALSNIKGILGVNQAAGNFNLQANVRAISDFPDGVTAAEISQLDLLNDATSADISVASIREGAFRNTVGLLSVNQASGVGNAEANSILISPNIDQEEISDDFLAQASLDVIPSSGRGSSNSSDSFRTVNVDETAFLGVKGVLQLNQAAGAHNVTQNRVFMQTVPSNSL